MIIQDVPKLDKHILRVDSLAMIKSKMAPTEN